MHTTSADRGPVRRARGGGFTLIELLIVIGIIVVLAGIGFTFTGPAREKARQTVCISNLHQIGLALQMYRTDWGGNDAARTPTEWDAPNGIFGLVSHLGGSRETLRCPSGPADTFFVDDNGVTQRVLAGYYGLSTWDVPFAPSIPEWGDAYAARGQAFPMLVDSMHNDPRPDRPQSQQFVIVWRVAGNVDTLYVRRLSPFWEW